MAKNIFRRFAVVVTAFAVLVGSLGGSPSWLSSPQAQAAAPVFTNNNGPSGNVPQGHTKILAMDITMPPIDADIFLDGDGDGSTAAGAVGPIAVGDALVQLVNGGTTLCGDTNGATAPANIVHDVDGNCISGVGVRTVILGVDIGATNDLGSSMMSLIGFRDIDGNDGGVYSLAEDDDLYLDTDYSEKYNADTIDAVTVGNLGTAGNAIDISGVQWWYDNGNGQFNPTEDTIADSVCPWNGASGHWECGDDVNVTYTVAGFALRTFITFDIATAAGANKTVQMRIPASFDFDGDGVFDATDRGIFFSNNGGAATGNHDGPAGNIDNADITTIILLASGNTSAPPPSSSDTSSGTSEPAPTNTETKTITGENGGEFTEFAANDGSSATVIVPEGWRAGDDIPLSAPFSFLVEAFTASEVYDRTPLPSDLAPGGKAVFDVSATVDGAPVSTFATPLRLKFSYQEQQLNPGVSEGDLRLATFDSGEGNWYVLEDAAVDTATNTVTYQASHLTRFALVSAADTVPPQPPSQLSAASIATGGVRLRWQNPVQDFHHVRISRSVDGSSTKELLATQVRTASYDDTTAQNGRTYSYFVASVDPAGNISSESRASIVPGTVVSAEPQQVATPADANDGDLVRASNTIEVYVTKKVGATVVIRHIVNSRVFDVYGHFGGTAAWSKVVGVDSLGSARTSAWVRGADGKVWEVNGDGSRHHMRMTWGEFSSRVAGGESDTGNNVVFEVNDAELSLYAVGADVMP